jgi:hypothetical protein
MSRRLMQEIAAAPDRDHADAILRDVRDTIEQLPAGKRETLLAALRDLIDELAP